MRKLVIAMAAAFATTGAFAQSATESSGLNSLVGVAPSTEDFVTEAATGDIFEIASSKLAVERGDSATKAFAKQMIQDHGKTTSELKSLVQSAGGKPALPASMAESQQNTLGALTKLQGKEFDDRYRSDQVTAHKDAVDLFKRYGEKGDQASFKEWASKTLPTLQHHLEMAQQLNK